MKGAEITCLVSNYYSKLGRVNKANDIHKGETPFSWFFSRLCRYGVQIFGGRFERVALLKPPVFIIFYFCVPKTFTVIKLRSGASHCLEMIIIHSSILFFKEKSLQLSSF